MNYARTALLLAVMTALFLGVGWLIGGAGGALIAFLAALGMNGWAWWRSDQAILRRHDARPVTRASAPELHDMVAELSSNAGLPMPRVFLINADQPNAFATGRDPDHAAVAATTGLLRALSREELAGVMAHELAHVKNRDTLVMTIAAAIGGAISFLAQFGLFFGGGRDRGPLGIVGVIAAALLAPFAAMLIQMMISRTREYAADREGAEICGQPLWLASALEKIDRLGRGQVLESAERDPASAHLFIANPLSGRGVDSLFATHPAMENRIARLNEMARSGGAPGREVRSARAVREARSRIPRSGRDQGPWA